MRAGDVSPDSVHQEPPGSDWSEAGVFIQVVMAEHLLMSGLC